MSQNIFVLRSCVVSFRLVTRNFVLQIEYTYQIVVNVKYLSEEHKHMLKMESIVLKPWDPMGSLAL